MLYHHKTFEIKRFRNSDLNQIIALASDEHLTLFLLMDTIAEDCPILFTHDKIEDHGFLRFSCRDVFAHDSWDCDRYVFVCFRSIDMIDSRLSPVLVSVPH